MNKERIQLWVDALESDEYYQGKGYLTEIVNGKELDCCLGVACKVAKKHGLNIEVAREYSADADDHRQQNEGHIEYDNDVAVLPSSVRKWYGFEDTDPALVFDADRDYDLGIIHCAEANDDRGLTFREIASLVRKTFLS